MKKPFPDTDYTIFSSLGDKLERIAKETLVGNRTSFPLYFNRAARQLVVDELGKRGFRAVSDNAFSGASALVFEANNHQMLRIVSAEADEAPRPKDDAAVLRPLKTFKFGKGLGQFTVELLPKIHTLDAIVREPKLQKKYHINAADAEGLIRGLVINQLHKGKVFYDPSLNNVGIIRTGKGENVALIIDPAASIERSRIDKICNPDVLPHNYRDLAVGTCLRDGILSDFPQPVDRKYREFLGKYWSINEIELPRYQPMPDDYRKAIDLYWDTLSKNPVAHPESHYQNAQRSHLRSLGLKPGANLVMSDADLDKWCALQEEGSKLNGMTYDRSQSVLQDLIKNKQLYPQEALGILADAAIPDPEGKKSFRERAKEKTSRYLDTKW